MPNENRVTIKERFPAGLFGPSKESGSIEGVEPHIGTHLLKVRLRSPSMYGISQNITIIGSGPIVRLIILLNSVINTLLIMLLIDMNLMEVPTPNRMKFGNIPSCTAKVSF